MNFVSKAMPMTRQGLSDALATLELGPGQTAALWSVFEVETAGLTQGYGFRADRRPQILFERHKFHDLTNGRFDAQAPDLSAKSAGGYGTLAQQYTKLERALQLCADAGLSPEPALMSASWGIGQVMGFNFAVAGYADATSMVQAMVASEDAQLGAMVGFLVSNDLDAAMRTQDWTTFARKYNGARYWEHQYDVKLEAQYARFSTGSMPDMEMRGAQAALLMLGFPPGKIDGVLGNRTRAALKSFQVANGLEATGELSGDTYGALMSAAFG